MRISIFASERNISKLKLKKIHFLVIKSYIGPLVLTFFIAIFILLMQFLWKYVDDLVGKGLEWYIIGELLFYASATFVPLALPLAILLSSIMTFGNLGEHYELVAMKSSGLSLKKIMAPLVVLSVAISISAFYFSNNILPRANLKFHSILYDVRQHRLAFNIEPGVFYKGIDGFVIRASAKEEDGSTLRDMMIYDHRGRSGNTNVTLAETGRMEISPDQRTVIFTLFNGHNYNEETEGRKKLETRPFQRSTFREQVRRFDLSGFELNRTDESLFRNNYHMFNTAQLRYARDSLQQELVEKKQDIRRTLITNFNHLMLTDTLPTDNLVPQANRSYDSLLHSLGRPALQRIFESALSSARNIRERISSIAYDHEYRARKIRKHEVELHRKFTLSFACLILFFIGAPLGAIIRKGGLGMPLVMSVLMFVVYHISSMMGEKFAKELVIPAWQGMWLASALFLPLGVFLTIKATTDAPLLDADGYRKRIERLLDRFSRKKQSTK